ncbi:hypothetical protein ACFQY4_25050 [Catellatospora bangladeshensis]|uniref:hypothetical protein n=1 Tax=Catellatospora bangladeshensis TaxID=310355 RepID=UPI0036122E16
MLLRSPEPVEGIRAILNMNQEDGGFDCPGCAWPDDPTGLRLDICENGVKHVTWEMAPPTRTGSSSRPIRSPSWPGGPTTTWRRWAGSPSR